MFNWLWKWLGYHVCEEFTQWQVFEQFYSRLPTPLESTYLTAQTVRFSRRYQRRQCTICGKVEERELKSGHGTF